MKFKEIINKITGISIPIFGISWNPPKLDSDIAEDVIIYLEGKRVLYVSSEMEVPSHCIQSVLEIKSFLTNQMMKVNNNSNIYEYMSSMRKACNKFLNRCNNHHKKHDIVKYGGQWGHWASWEFASALGEMRGLFGVMIMSIASTYGLDVEDELASIIPD